jgi:cytochrome c oxidase subunit 2
MMARLWIAILALVAGLVLPGAESALAIDAVNWGLGLQEAATPVAESMHRFHDLLLIMCIVIVVFVLALLIIVIVRFREKRNPVPSRTVHNTLIEVIWTAVPVAILVVIAFPSFDLLYQAHDTEDAQLNVKVYGNTWNWTYEYPDQGNFQFTANMVPKEDLKEGQPRNLATDVLAVIPSGTKVRFTVTSNDTLHSFAMPAWGVKIDAVPGRLNETWAEVPAKYEGHIFYGQCSELCGVGHAFMPIAIKVVSPAEFEAWVAEAKKEYGTNEVVPAPVPVSVAGQ